MARQKCRRQSRCAPRQCRGGFTWVELLVVIALLGLLVSFLMPSLCSSRETANRVKCASNLRQISQALLLYANENGWHYPRVIYTPGPIVQPVCGTGASGPNPFVDTKPNDVSAALFLLIRTQDITAEVFTCPSSNAEKDPLGGSNPANPLLQANFTDVKKNLSYSVQNPYPRDGAIPADDKNWWTSNMSAEFAIAADINPGTSPATADDVRKPAVVSSAKDMKFANSNNHDKDGQNILYGDGHVAWESNPFAGIDRDNIYTTADDQVIASPTHAKDSILLPTDD